MKRPDNPYPGLRRFEREDAHLFFGRKAQVKELRDRLRDKRFTAVVGLSGSGKSSLIRAGLLPELHLGGMGPQFADWRVAAFEPGMDPIGALAQALDDPRVLGPDPEGVDVLQRSSHGLAERAIRACLPDGAYLLIVVDQFEEIFRFRRERTDGAEEATRFVRLLLDAVADESSRVHVLLTMRSDFLGECAQFRGLPEKLNDSQYLVRLMTRDERRDAIVEPARLVHVTVTPELVERLLNEAGDDPDRLPVLQHALMRTFDVGYPGPLTVDHYKTIGTMENALEKHALEVFGALAAEDQKCARRMFQRLSERRAGSRDIRRPASVQDIAEVAGVPPTRIEKIFNHFSGPGCTFLTSRMKRQPSTRRPEISEKLAPDALVDVTHESLLNGWTELNRWIDREEERGRRFIALAGDLR